MRTILNINNYGETSLVINNKELYFNRPSLSHCVMFFSSKDIPNEKLIPLFSKVKTSKIGSLYVPYVITKIIIYDDTIITTGEGPYFKYTTVSINDLF